MVTCVVVGCDQESTCHVLFGGAFCGRRDVFMCGGHTLALAARAAPFVDQHGCAASHVADHRLAPQCRHPDARWVGDRCEIEGLSLLEDVEQATEVPA